MLVRVVCPGTSAVHSWGSSLTQPDSLLSLYKTANSQNVDCFASTDCTGTPIVDASVTDARTCCIGDGFSYDAMDGSGCQICNGMAGRT